MLAPRDGCLIIPDAFKTLLVTSLAWLRFGAAQMIDSTALAGLGDTTLRPSDGIALCVVIAIMAGNVAVEKIPLRRSTLAVRPKRRINGMDYVRENALSHLGHL